MSEDGKHAMARGRRPVVAALGLLLVACGPGADDGGAPAAQDHLEAARAFVEQGRQDSALARYDLAVAEGSEPAAALNERGMTLAARGELGRAEADLDSALSLRPDYTAALGNLAVVHLEMRRWEQALAELDSLARLRPDSAKVYYDRAHAHEGLGRPDRALEDLGRALRRDSGLVQAYLTRGNLHARRGQLDRAIADFEAAVSRSGRGGREAARRHLESARRNLGVAHLEAGHHAEALEVFDALVRRHPLRARYHMYRGRAYRALGRDAEAAADFRRTLELTGNPGLRQQVIPALREMEGGS